MARVQAKLEAKKGQGKGRVKVKQKKDSPNISKNFIYNDTKIVTYSII
jgi:hypothetical protein